MPAQEKLDKLFAILRIVHTSHWKAPKLELVQREIRRTGAYIFRAGRAPWVAEVRITENSIEYVVNSELPDNFRKKADEMKKKFDELTRALW
jgi:hypothetical protein